METHEAARVARARRLHGLYAIVNDGDRCIEIARAAVSAGCRLVQYRAKSGIVPERVRMLRDLTRDAGALLLLNDDWRAASALACDGVHLGPDDDGFDDVRAARAVFADGIIGLSCGTPAEMLARGAQAIDYAGVGAVYATASKSDAGPPIGIEGLRAVIAVATVPVCAIGGLDATRLSDVRRSGAAMAAVISALDGPDPAESARALVAAWGER